MPTFEPVDHDPFAQPAAAQRAARFEPVDYDPFTQQSGGTGAAGLLEPGNIDLGRRPVVNNPDDSFSTVRSIGVNIDGREYLIPTVSDNGRNLSDKEAVATFRMTGKHLGAFDNPQNATAYAQRLHEDQSRQYGAQQDIRAPGGMDAAFASLPSAGSGDVFDRADLAEVGLQRLQQERAKQEAGAPKTGAFNNFTAGLNGAIYSVAGMPVDAATWLLNKAGQQARAVSGAPVQEIQPGPLGSQSLARWGEMLGINDPEKVAPANPGQQVARAAGAGVGYAIAPEAALAGLGRLGAVSEGAVNIAGKVLGRSTTAGDLAANAVVGGASGAGGELVAERLPEKYRPLGEMVGGLLAGGMAAGATAIPAAVRAGAGAAGDYLAPLTVRGQERTAAQTLDRRATNPEAVREAIETAPREIVPGSNPTSAQLTGDMGLSAVERGVKTKAPDEFNQRFADQNTARLTALEGIEPKGAASENVVAALRQGLADLDASTAAALDTATTNARSSAGAIGGRGTPEGYGATVRQGLSEAETAARAKEGALWKAVDPDGTLALPASDTKKSALEIARSQPKSAKPMEGEERAIFLAAARLPDVAPFSEMTALRSRVSTAMRQELRDNGRTPVYARMSQLRGKIEGDIEGAVSRQAEAQEQAVARGEMSEEDTIAAFLRRDIQGWNERRAAEASLGQNSGAIGGGDAPFGAGGAYPVSGRQVPGGGKFPDAPGAEGIQGSRLEPNFDAEAVDRLKAASAATKERAQTYGNGPVGQVLRKEGSEGPYRVPFGTVPSKFFHPGRTGYEDVQALRKAASPEVVQEVRDYALSTLRSTAERPDGTLDPKKVEIWKRTHADALRAFPEIEGLVANPVRASQAMEGVAIQRKAALDAYQTGVVAKLLQIEDPADVSRAVGAVFHRQDATKQMLWLRRQFNGNPDAGEGLKKAITDYVTNRFVSNTEAATSGQGVLKSDAFQTFIRENTAALRAAGFKDRELNVMRAIAGDLQRSNRSVTAAKLPGQSNTAQDTIEAAGGTKSALAHLVGIIASAAPTAGASAVGYGVAGPIGGAAAFLGASAVSAMRKAGLANVDDIIKDAILNPERMRTLFEQFPMKPTRRDEIRIMQRYRKALPAALGFDDQEAR